MMTYFNVRAQGGDPTDPHTQEMFETLYGSGGERDVFFHETIEPAVAKIDEFFRSFLR